MASVIDKYLRFYAEPEAAVVSDFPARISYDQVLVIPAYKETAEFLEQFIHPQFSNALIILVINQPSVIDEPYQPHAVNQSLAEIIQVRGRRIWQRKNLQLFELENFSLLVVDRFSCDPIPRKQGVGLARKIGCDLAAGLIRKNIIRSPVIHTSDADVILPIDYFRQATEEKDVSAQLYSFRHLCRESKVGLATKDYELSIRYYVDGLKWAGSPYGFHTIGSCIAVSAFHYCQARGFPKRSGGEDFYLLNKLAKLGKVVELNGKPILIAARKSDRAPFGTGKAVSEILAQENRVFNVYDPRVFAALKAVLEHFFRLPEMSRTKGEKAWLNPLDTPVKDALSELGIAQFFQHIQSQRFDSAQTAKQVPQWFDGFRTLKFVNYMQRHTYPAIPVNQALPAFEELKRFSP